MTQLQQQRAERLVARRHADVADQSVETQAGNFVSVLHYTLQYGWVKDFSITFYGLKDDFLRYFNLFFLEES